MVWFNEINNNNKNVYLQVVFCLVPMLKENTNFKNYHKEWPYINFINTDDFFIKI